MHASQAVGCLAVALGLSLAGVARAESPQPISVAIQKPGLGDTAHLLHIKKMVGTFELDAKAKSVTLLCEFYKNGQVQTEMTEVRAELDPVEGGTKGEFAIQIADIDYVQLGDAQKNHCRVVLELKLGHNTLNPVEIDVPKYEFDLGRRMIGNSADWKSGDGYRFPVFMFTGGKSRLFNPVAEDHDREQPRSRYHGGVFGVRAV